MIKLEKINENEILISGAMEYHSGPAYMARMERTLVIPIEVFHTSFGPAVTKLENSWKIGVFPRYEKTLKEFENKKARKDLEDIANLIISKDVGFALYYDLKVTV